jgi:hypothetical protein
MEQQHSTGDTRMGIWGTVENGVLSLGLFQ